jgi:ATP-dependent protease ClpP protease subunit
LQGLKPYNVAVDPVTNSATINLYGEVIETHPVDWWTGEPVPGNFIALDDFMRDLDELASCSDITVHINSGGGDMYAGIAIYNRLKALPAKVTTIDDGLAASAASLIFMAGDTRKVHAGSNTMIHGAASFVFGYYQKQDAEAFIKRLEAHNKAGINIYAERTEKDKDAIRQMVEAETWMTGQEAVDEGFAHEVITDEEGEEPVTMKLSPDRSRLMVGGRAVAACLLGKLPDGIPCMTAEEYAATAAVGGTTIEAEPAPQVSDNNSNGGMNEMEITNVADLRRAYPEFCAEIENSARTEGATAERQRIQGIENMRNAVADAEMVRNAMYGDNRMSVADFAIAVLTQQAAIGNTMLNNMQADTNASGAANVAADPNGGADPVIDEAAEAQKQIDEAVKNFNMMNGGKK